MEIRIRRASEATGRHLTTANHDELDEIIPMIERWELSGEDGGRPLSAQIVVGSEGTQAYFEVIIDDMGES